MEELLINEKNKDQFYESIIKSLNCDIAEVKTKVNFELLGTYIKTVFSKDPKRKDLLNPLVIKISKFKNIYDEYIESITKTTYSEYFIKIKLFLKEENNIKEIKSYLLDNLNHLDLTNEIEDEMSKIYSNHLLNKGLNTYKDEIWFINYVIKKEAINYNINPDIKVINLPYIKNSKLSKNKPYKKYKDIKKINNLIDLYSYKANKIAKNKDSLKLLLDNCFLYLQDIIFTNLNITKFYSKEIYSLLKETIAYNNDKSFLISNPLLEIAGLSKIEITKESIQEFNNYIDELVASNNELLNTYPLLKLEYNDNGYKKTLRELLNVKIEKLTNYNNQINEYSNILKETENEIVKNKISSDLNELNKNLSSIEAFHNYIIFNSLSLLSILDLTKLLPRMTEEETECLKDAAIAEKNIIIKKLEANRRKIFKPTTFLKNEEILTKEYKKAAGYESKINDYQKNQE